MKNYKVKIVLKRQTFGWFLCLLFLFGCEAAPNSPEWDTIEHEQYHFSIEYPTKWVVELYGDAGRKGNHDVRLEIQRSPSFLGHQNSPATFSIVVEQMDFDKPTLQEALYWGNEKILQNFPVKDLESLRGYREFLFQEEEVAGYFAIRRRYTHSALGEVTREEVYILRQDDIVLLRLWLSEDYFDDFYPDFERIVNSFKTIPSN